MLLWKINKFSWGEWSNQVKTQTPLKHFSLIRLQSGSSLQFPAHPPKSYYSACGNQQTRVRDAGRASAPCGGTGPGGRREFPAAAQRQLREQRAVLLHHTPFGGSRSWVWISRVVEAPFQKAQRRKNTVSSCFGSSSWANVHWTAGVLAYHMVDLNLTIDRKSEFCSYNQPYEAWTVVVSSL